MADWYVEASKNNPNNELLKWALEFCLKLAHPFAPFVTETIWQSLPWTSGILASQNFSEKLEYNEMQAKGFERIQELVIEIRRITAELPKKKHYNLIYSNDGLIDENSEIIKHLSRVPEIIKSDNPQGFALAGSGLGAFLDIPNKILIEYKEDLKNRVEILSTQIQNLESRLANKNYVEKAPKELVEETRLDLSEKRAELSKVQKEFDNL